MEKKTSTTSNILEANQNAAPQAQEAAPPAQTESNAKEATAVAQGTSAIESTKAYAFTGKHFPQSVTRVFTTPDPGNPNGRPIVSRKKFDAVTNLVIDRVAGMGYAERTGEKYVTLAGQYGPFAKARITASSQNADTMLDLIRGNVNKEDPNHPLKEKIVVDIVGSPMKGFGFNIEELYLHTPEGKKQIIGTPVSEQSSQEANLAGAFL